MRQADAILKALHSLTLVQRTAVFRPKPGETTDAIGTQVVFITNELMHAIASYWPRADSIKREIERWRHEIANLASRMPHQKLHEIRWPLEAATTTLAELIKSCETDGTGETVGVPV
jgi:hypothetical protein